MGVYEDALKIKTKKGWNNKEWSRHTGIDLELLNEISSDAIEMTDELAEYIYNATKKPIRKNINDMLTFSHPQVITTCIHKGGSGKTTCVSGIATTLVNKGYHVLVIDTDSQMDCTRIYLSDDVDTSKNNIYTALVTEQDLKGCIYHTDYDNLDIIPSDIKMSAIEPILIAQGGVNTDTAFLFKKLLRPIIQENQYDFILIDTDKNIGTVSRTLFNASNHVLMITECSFFNITGIVTMHSQYEEIQRTTNPDLNFLGVILNKVMNRKNIVAEAAGSIDELFENKRFQNVIHIDSKIEQAQWNNMPVQVFSKSSKATKDFSLVTDELLERLRIYQ